MEAKQMTKPQMIDINLVEPNTGQVPGLPKNPRQWTKAEIQNLKRSISETPELFMARGLLVYPYNGKYVVLGGNMRLEASKLLKLEQVPCIIFDASTPVDKLAEIVIKDNGSFGSWDYDQLANEWDNKPLTEWGVPAWDPDGAEDDKKEAKEDNFNPEAEPIEVKCRRGDIWILGEHRLMCGDSIELDEVKKLMEGGVADLWVTDPPYNVDYEGGNGEKIMNDNMDDAQFNNFLSGAFSTAAACLKPGGAYYIWHSDGKGLIFRRAAEEAGLETKQVLIWNKNTFVLGRQDYQWKHEPCLYGWKPGAAHYFVDWRTLPTVIEDSASVNPKQMKKEELVDFVTRILDSPIQTTVLNEDKPQRSAEHPTMKPVRLIGTLIRNSSRPGEIVLDSFGGSGTTLIAAEQLGRRARLMELDPHYCDVIIARWEKLTGQQATLLENYQRN